jgi:nitrogen regulatory protein PII 2
MKQVIAIIREECVEPTTTALAGLGIAPVAAFPVMGRGQQKGAVNVPDQHSLLGRNIGSHLRRPQGVLLGTGFPDYRPPKKKKTAFRFLPKRMLFIIADDPDIEPVVRAIITVNRSGRHGDGKIFVCPLICAA